MKYVTIITDDFGKTASGICIEKYLISLLSSGYKVNVFTYSTVDNSPNIFKMPSRFGIEAVNLKKSILLNRIEKLCLIAFGFSFFNIFYSRRSIVKFINYNDWAKRDFMILFVAGDSFLKTMELPMMLDEIKSSRLFIHFFDPKPGLLEWNENPLVVKAVQKIVRKYVGQASVISAVSLRMLEMLKQHYGSVTTQTIYKVLPLVIEDNFDCYEYSCRRPLQISYFGAIYGNRDIRPFLKALSVLKLNDSSFEFVFSLYGDNFRLADLINEYPLIKSSINLQKWSDNILNLVTDTDILLDVNSFKTGDPFISSKLFYYLGFSRPIIVISGEGSASGSFAANFESVFVTEVQIEKIADTLSVILSEKHSFSKRAQQIQQFSSANILNGYLIE